MKKENFFSLKSPKEYGLTLIALVVSVIVLLILVGVTIQLFIGDNGLIKKTENAVYMYNEGNIEDQIKMAYVEYQMKKIFSNDLSLENSMKESLESVFDEIVNVEQQGRDVKVTFMNSNSKYKYYSNGTVKRLMDPSTNLYGMLDEDNGILYLGSTQKDNYDLFRKTTSNYYEIDRQWDANKILKIVIEEPIATTSASHMFVNCSNLEEIINLNNFHTENIDSMNNMFNGCSSLKKIDLNNFDTSNVKNMDEMFSSCKKLKSIDVSSFDTSNVKSMASMFKDCQGLTSLDLSYFDTSNVTNMRAMFINCFYLTNLNLSTFNTNKVQNMATMFCGCNRLKNLNLGKSFTMNSVTNSSNMFQYSFINIRIRTIQETANKIKEIRTDYNNDNFEIID